MAEMSDHDRIEEIQAYIRGMLVAVKALLDALEVVAAGNPERSEALHPLIMNACSYSRPARIKRAGGVARWDARSERLRKPPPHLSASLDRHDLGATLGDCGYGQRVRP